jgi:dTDP-4-dehydrorhamnose reductase
MRFTVFGASGLLGQALVPKLKDEQLTALSSKDADIRDASEVRRVIEAARPEWVIVAAAYTDVDGCESNRELAFSVNRDGAVNVARAARDTGARLIFLSSDYVFDGNKGSPYEADDRRNPMSVYGESKAQAEEQLLQILPDIVIVRTSWLFGVGGKCFPATILKIAATRPELRVVNDQRGSPTLTDDLGSALVELCRKNASGIVHMTNSGDCTWYEFASEIVKASGLDTEVKPVSTSEFPRPARRPAYSVLSPATRIVYGIEMPSWQDALRRYLGKVSAFPPAR